MTPELTTEQKEKIKNWAEQRDTLLSENAILRTENEQLHKTKKELSDANTNIIARMNEVKGRIEELKIKESELPLVMSKEVAFLQSKKSTLEAEITTLAKLVDVLATQKTSLEADVSFALGTFEVLKGETLLLDKVVDRVTQVSLTNKDRINSLVDNLATSLEEIIEVNRKNVRETNIVIDKVPKMIMEAQKKGLIKNKI